MADVFLPGHAWLPGPVFDVLRGAVAATGVVVASGVTGLEPLTATTNNLLSIGAILGFTALYATTGGLRSVVATAIALVVMANLGSVQTAWFLSLMFGAGMGSVLVMRWLWEGINLWSELAAIATSLVVAPILLFTTSVEWLRLGVMAAATTAAAIGAGVALVPAWWGRVREG